MQTATRRPVWAFVLCCWIFSLAFAPSACSGAASENAALVPGTDAPTATPTLNGVRNKNFVQCGVTIGVAGFSTPDAQGEWRGLDVDVCRAIAAAVLGDASKVRFTPLTAALFDAPRHRRTQAFLSQIFIDGPCASSRLRSADPANSKASSGWFGPAVQTYNFDWADGHGGAGVDMDTEYVLGTNDEEIGRLAIQHQLWRPRVLSAWQHAGFRPDQTLVDIGCGPGFGSLDLAELVGPNGRVVAVDRSKRFLTTLDASCAKRGLSNITTHEMDLDAGTLPMREVDGAWCRWVFTFVTKPRQVLERVCATLKPGAALALHEYFDYGAWRMAPQSDDIDDFVKAVMASWRDAGGEPDIGLTLPQWTTACGLEITSVRPIVDIVSPGHPSWMWLRAFIQTGRQRLVDLGYLTDERAIVIWDTFKRLETTAGTLMVTPGVIEVIARRRELNVLA